MLRREPRDAAELQFGIRRQGVANPKRAAIQHTDHVAGPRLLDRRSLAREKLLRRREADHLVGPNMLHLHPRLEPAGTDAHEGHAISMLRIHVRLNLEHEPGELLIRWMYEPRRRFSRRRLRRELEKLAKERLDAKIRQRPSKKPRRELP